MSRLLLFEDQFRKAGVPERFCLTCGRSHGKLGVKSAFDFQPDTWSTHVISVIPETCDGGSGDKLTQS